MKRKRAQCKDVRNRSILGLYNKLHEVVGLLADLLSIQTLTDTTVLQLSTLGVCPFFVENVSELQLSALRLVTKVCMQLTISCGTHSSLLEYMWHRLVSSLA